MTTSSSSFDQEIEYVIPAIFHLIGSARDDQQSNESYNVDEFGLPNPASKMASACTAAFLKLQYDALSQKNSSQTWFGMLQNLRQFLADRNYPQTPVLSSSRRLNKYSTLELIPRTSRGADRRAVLIGINYIGDPKGGELKACQSDCLNVHKFLKDKLKFKDKDITMLVDDGHHTSPTRANIIDALLTLTKQSQAGDVNFIYYSGHGGRVEDNDGEEEDGFDSAIFPVDFRTEGNILDDHMLTMLVKPMSAGVNTTVLMDCCYAGTMLDLPYETNPTTTNNRNGRLPAAAAIEMKAATNYNMDLVRSPIRPLSKKERAEAKQKEREARRAAREAERERLAQEERRQQASSVTYVGPSQADLDAAQQQLLREAQRNLERQVASTSGGNRTIVSTMGPVVHQTFVGGPPPPGAVIQQHMILVGPDGVTQQCPVGTKTMQTTHSVVVGSPSQPHYHKNSRNTPVQVQQKSTASKTKASSKPMVVVGRPAFSTSNDGKPKPKSKVGGNISSRIARFESR